MSQGPALLERSGRRTLLALAGSGALLLGTWLALRRDTADPTPPSVQAELAPVRGVQPAAVDPIRRLAADDLPGEAHAAAPPVPRIDPVPEHLLTPERRAALANPVPQVLIDGSGRAALEAARAAATTQLQDLLDERRSAMQRACARKGKHASAPLVVQVRFGADGTMIEKYVDDRGEAPEIRDCVAAQPLAMTVPPPGVEMSVRATLSLL